MTKLLIVTGPSGIGKTYLANQIIQKYPRQFAIAKWYSTRQPRSGETSPDRIFISPTGFAAKEQAGDFFISETFHDHQYGYPASALKPADKNLIANAWPDLLPRFIDVPDVCMVGLTTDIGNLDLLKRRMISRGDSTERTTQRLEYVKRDIADMERQRGLITSHGNLFAIKTDAEIPEKVIPWIEEFLGLS